MLSGAQTGTKSQGNEYGTYYDSHNSTSESKLFRTVKMRDVASDMCILDSSKTAELSVVQDQERVENRFFSRRKQDSGALLKRRSVTGVLYVPPILQDEEFRAQSQFYDRNGPLFREFSK